MSRRRVVLGVLVVVLAGMLAGVTPSVAGAAGAPLAVTVSGNRLVDAAGSPVRLQGANRSGTEYACVQGWGIFSGPVDDAAIAAMTGWGSTTVRVPLNQDCWLGLNGVSTTYGGAAYRTAIVGYVQRLHAAGLLAVLELERCGHGPRDRSGVDGRRRSFAGVLDVGCEHFP